MSFAGEGLGSVTILALTISIGLCIDYSAHVAIAYSHARGASRQRVLAGLQEIGPSVLKGGVSTLTGISAVGFAQSATFVSWFNVLFSATLFGLLHALLILPMMLCTLGGANEGWRRVAPEMENEAGDGL